MAKQIICRVEGCVNRATMDDIQFCQSHLSALLDHGNAVKVAVPHCTAQGCALPPKSGFWPYCQMHDARYRRHGNVDHNRRLEISYHSHGYRLIPAQGHPMARGKGKAFEHRVVYYDANPEGPKPCHWCGCELSWDTLQVDHLNTVRDDNRLDNLVPSCGPCNRDRAKPAAAKAARARARGYMVNGKWLSIADAARAIGVAASSIELRLRNGWPVERALTEPRGRFGPKRAA